MAAAATGSTGEIDLENRLKPSRPRRDPPVITDTTREPRNVAGEMPKRHILVTGSNSETQQKHPIKGRAKADGGSGAETPQKNYRKVKTGAISGMPAAREKKHLKGNASLSRDSSLCNSQELTSEAHHRTGPSLDTSHGNTTAVDGEGSAARDGYLTEEMIQNVKEANNTIQQLNELGLGEDISYEELAGYLQRLPSKLPRVDTFIEPDCEQLNELQVRNILYRIKYCKFACQRRQNNEMFDANLEDDHSLYHLEEKLECLEEDGGYEYENWNRYRRYCHSYEVELEYLFYWEELLKKLKWMEDYVAIKRPSLKWGKICTRGCYQAIKIATRYSKITEGLARAAYYACINTMCLDICRDKELDVIYLEIWQRITMQKESFRDALNEVYKSNKFPRHHQKMKNAVENDNWSEMEKKFHICTAGIAGKITEDKALELITDAIKNQRGRPKFYAQYIKKKIEIATAIGVITKP